MLSDLSRRFVDVALVATALAAGCAPRVHPATAGPEKRLEFSILEDYDKDADLADIARDFDLFKELGITTWRGSFGWDDYEPTPGAYDFDWLHRFADLAASRGITLRPYIGYTPAWAAAGGADKDVWNDAPKDLDAWFRFVRARGRDAPPPQRGVIRDYNEENVRQWWDGSAAAYSDVLNRAAEAVEAGNPDAEVLLGGMVFPDAEWTEHVCGDERNRRSISVIPFHAYPETWTPPDVVVENYLGVGFARFVSEADAACGPKPIWINEMGFATTPGVTEADQARWWVRAVATFAATPRIEHLGIYEIKDLRRDRPVIGDAPNYHLGLTHVDRRKKLAFGTVARLVSMLRGHSFTWSAPEVSGSASTPVPEVYRHLFTRADGRQWLFLWTRQQRTVVDIQLSKVDSRAAEFSLDGTPAAELAIADGTLPRITLEPGQARFFEIVR